MSQQEINRVSVLKQIELKQLTQVAAAKVMGLSDRQTRRLMVAYRARGSSGIVHGLRGQPSNHQLKPELADTAISIVRAHYGDFGPTFASEKLAEIHNINIRPETLRRLMTASGLWRPKQRKVAKYYERRERKACYGEMLQFDGSDHQWFEERAPRCSLLANIDDATNTTYLRFARYEGTASVMDHFKRHIEYYGKPNSIYLDRHSTYKVNHKNALDEVMLSQFERACKELGIEVIHAYSPQAKGRVERLFNTLQDRLVKELRLRGISTINEANVFLEKEFTPKFNKRFTVKPRQSANLHFALSSKEDLDQILSMQHKRVVGNDFTIRFKNNWLQLAKQQPTLVLPKKKVTIEERLDNTLHLRLNNQYLDYKILTERPPQQVQPIALTTAVFKRPIHRPAQNHPWRTPMPRHFKGTKRIPANA